MKNLFEIMQGIVEEKMESYKSDFIIDQKILLESKNNEFYWYVRKSGTNMLEVDKLGFINSEEHTTANYFLPYKELCIFKIKVTKRTKKNVYGTIESVSKKEIKEVIDNAKAIKGIVAKITLNDGSVIEGELNDDSNQRVLYNLLNQKGIPVEDLKSYEVIKYIG